MRQLSLRAATIERASLQAVGNKVKQVDTKQIDDHALAIYDEIRLPVVQNSAEATRITLPASIRAKLQGLDYQSLEEGNPALYNQVVSYLAATSGLASCSIHDVNGLLYWIPKEYRRHHVDRILDMMKTCETTPNLNTYHSFMDAYASMGSVDRTEYYFEKLTSAGLLPSEVSFVLLLQSHSHSTNVNVNAASEIISRIEVAGIRPNIIHYSILINIYTRAELFNKAWDVWALVKYLSVETAPDSLAYFQILRLCAREKNAEKALDIWLEMQERGISPEPAHYTALAHACSMRQEYYLEAWKQAGTLLKDGNYLITCNVMLGACGKNGDLTAARALFSRIMLSPEAPDHASFMGIFRSYANFRPKHLTEKVSISATETKDTVNRRKWTRHTQQLHHNLGNDIAQSQMIMPIPGTGAPAFTFSTSLELETVWAESFRLFGYTINNFPHLLDVQLVDAFFSILANHTFPSLTMYMESLYTVRRPSPEFKAGDIPPKVEGRDFSGPPFAPTIQFPSTYKSVEPSLFTYSIAMQAAYEQKDQIGGDRIWKHYQDFSNPGEEFSSTQSQFDKKMSVLRMGLLAKLGSFTEISHMLASVPYKGYNYCLADLISVYTLAKQARKNLLTRNIENLWRKNREFEPKKTFKWVDSSAIGGSYTDQVKHQLTSKFRKMKTVG